MYELVRLTVRGFRGFAGEQDFSFDHPVVLLCGENHRGKSSTLNAAEWCLFGDECIGKKTGIRERVGWEIANRHLVHGDVIVTAVFSSPDGIFNITREQSITKKRGAQTVTVLLPDGTKLQGDEAENSLYALFHSSFQDFMTTVYQHQEAIRAILVQEPRERNEGIDRLLGLSPYREILKGINNAKLDEALSHMESRREDFRTRCEQAIRTLGNLVKDEKTKAIATGILEKDLTEKEALRIAHSITDAVKSLARELGTDDLAMTTPTNLEQVTEFHENVKNQTDRLWTQSPDVLKQEALNTEKSTLGALKGNYMSAKEGEMAKQRERDEFVKAFGDETGLNSAAEEQKQAITQLDEQVRTISAKANLVREAIQYLRDVVPDAQKGRCPVCGTDAPDLLNHLESEWEDQIKGKVDELEQQKTDCRSRLKLLESQKGDLETLQRQSKDAQLRREKCATEIATALRLKVSKQDDPLALLGKRTDEIDSELKATADAIAKKRGNISNIYDQLGKLKTIQETLIHEQRKGVIEHIWGTKEFTELEEELNEAAQFVEDAKVIQSALAEAAREEAEAKIQAAQTALDKYFCCIVKHPAIPGLIMEVKEDPRTGLNSYIFKSSDGTDPTPILSQGDLNCLALSLFLGLSEATLGTGSFAFIMLDDPTQSLGSEMKRELVGVLADIANRRKLIIATPDIEFKNLLESKITKGKTIYDFVGWTKEGGPQVTRSA